MAENTPPGWTEERPQSSTQSQFSFFTPPSGNRPRIVNIGFPGSNTPGRLTLGRAHEAGTRILRSNINQVINELSPIMNQARSTHEAHGLSLSSWLRRAPPAESSVPHAGNSHSIVINLDGESNSSSSRAMGRPYYAHTQQPLTTSHSYHHHHHHAPSSNNASTNNTNSSANNNTSNNSSNNSDDAIDALRQAPEAQSVLNVIQKYIPFALIVLVKALYDHRAGILIFLGLLVAFIHSNSVVKREVSKQSKRSLLSLLFLFVNIMVCICMIYFIFQDQKLYKSLVFIPPYSQPLNIWDLLWIVGITDFVLKLITIQVKIGMALLPGWVIPYAARGKWFLMVESTSQLYRGLAPIQPWLYYLLESYQGAEKVVGVFLSAAYMVSKGADLMSKLKLFRQALWKMVQNVSLGVSPSKEQLDTAGSQCPICHDDYDTPVLLHCRHVFCEACVTTWFDREQTCPLCRAKVVDDPSWRDGATTMFVQLY